MTEPFGKFKRKHGKGSDREHVPLAAINSYAGGAYPTCRLATGVRRSVLPTATGCCGLSTQRTPGMCWAPGRTGAKHWYSRLRRSGLSLLG
jgi:hypothetical protein